MIQTKHQHYACGSPIWHCYTSTSCPALLRRLPMTLALLIGGCSWTVSVVRIRYQRCFMTYKHICRLTQTPWTATVAVTAAKAPPTSAQTPHAQYNIHPMQRCGLSGGVQTPQCSASVATNKPRLKCSTQ